MKVHTLNISVSVVLIQSIKCLGKIGNVLPSNTYILANSVKNSVGVTIEQQSSTVLHFWMTFVGKKVFCGLKTQIFRQV